MNLKNFVRVYNLIPTQVCNDVIHKYDSLEEWKTHQWYNPVADEKKSQHNKELDVLYNQDLDVLKGFVLQAVVKYHEDLNIKENLVSNHSNIRLNKYKTGRIMSEHFDLIRRNKTDGIPVLSLVGALNDNYNGGQFLMNNEVITLKQGDILVFPSTFLYPHKVTEVTEGTRYTFVTWAY
jgi:predicted 2-oxoglutarate/Fe(II)-dependent dioxygenase YbiX